MHFPVAYKALQVHLTIAVVFITISSSSVVVVVVVVAAAAAVGSGSSRTSLQCRSMRTVLNLSIILSAILDSLYV